jgi:hypothetical protein
VFPDIDCPPLSPEFEPWEAIDRNALKIPVSKLVLNVLAGKRKQIRGFQQCSESGIREIRQFLRPDFERIVARPTIVSECETSLIALTEDQYSVLDMISENPRYLIEGAAGTGKTILALEYSRRQAAEGKKVLLLCFNRLLGEWFQSRVSTTAKGSLTSNSYFRFLRESILKSPWREEFEAAEQNAGQEQLFSEVLPLYGLLAAESLNVQFDVLVLDEAQDLLKPDTVAFLGTVLKGGMTGGRWYVFGDFTRQCIYGNASRDECLQTLKSACQGFSLAKLQTNCRNTRRIGEETALLSGFASPPYKLGQVDGLPVDYRYWRNSKHQLDKLTKLIQELIVEGMNPQDFVLLSSRKFSDSIAAQLLCATKTYGTISATEIRSGVLPLVNKTRVGFATIQSFKGMESKAVIICDIEHVENDAPQALLYTGMSRARSLLILMVHESVGPAIAKSLARRLTEGWKL